MKRFLGIVVALFVCIPMLNAQNFGIKAGMYFNTMSDLKPIDGSKYNINVKARTGFHAGVVYKLNLPAGLALQPELLYINKASKLSSDAVGAIDNTKFNLHYMQLPVGLQWGIDLVMFRPFIQAVPYVGYAISKGGEYKHLKWDDINRFEYGLGLGAGLEIWKIQLSGRYSWDLGTVADFKIKDAKANVIKSIKGNKNKGFELSLAILF